jgi:hypothetical protein
MADYYVVLSTDTLTGFEPFYEFSWSLRDSIDFFFYPLIIITMAIDSVLNSVLTVPVLSDVTKEAAAADLPTCEDLEDLCTDLAADKKKVEATFRLTVDTDTITNMTDILDPHFAWSNFVRSVYVADKRAQVATKAAVTPPTNIATTTATVINMIDFSTNVLLVDAKPPL